MQSRLSSLAESMCNVAIGYGVAVLSQWVIFPWYGIDLPVSENMTIALWFTVVSVIRSYVLRRWFNSRLKRLLS